MVIPLSAQAETRLTAMTDLGNKTLTKEGNPYILEGDMNLQTNTMLTIKEGVILTVASSSDPYVPYINGNGSVQFLGTKEEPITVKGLSLSIFRGKNNKIEHTIFDHSKILIGKFPWDPMGTTTIRSNKFTGSDVALEVVNNTVQIEDSEFSSNGIGLFSDEGASNTNISVKNSYFENNSLRNIENQISKPIDAAENWWGSADGPGTSVKGSVLTLPWKTKDDRVKEAPCCSSVLFLPGLQASRLYTVQSGSENRLWEPNRNEDVRKLYLDESGKSIDSTIYTRDIVDAAFGIKKFYRDFFAQMKAMVAENKINEWLPFAYDWRMAMEDIVLGQTAYATTTKNLIKEVESLAKNSKTGKVTVLAHSNGGLIAKMLGNELEKEGKIGLLDKVVLIASPVLGTPQAAAALLHGYDQALLYGLVAKSGVMRTLGLNMNGAYGLIPGAAYIEKVGSYIKKDGSLVDRVKDFLTGILDGRTQPKENDLKSPAVLSKNLLDRSNGMHEVIDNWKFPESVQAISLAGWGLPTTSLLEYSSTSPRIKKSPQGDGTVMTASASNFGTPYFFNQGLYNFEQKKDSSHADIFETDPVKGFISKILATTSLTYLMSPHITTSQPTEAGPWMKWITVSVHSPVDMDVYDSKSNHMGLVPLPSAPDSDLQWFENTIGGQYDMLGDEKYYTLPADETYTIKFKGTGVGNFTFQIQKYTGNEMTEVANVLYEKLPVTPLLLGSTTITSTTLTPTLALDVDGNGTSDITTGPGPMNPMLHLDAMRTIIVSLSLDKNDEKHLLQKIEKVRMFLLSDKREQVIKKIKQTITRLDEKHWNLKTLTQADKDLLGGQFEALLSALEAS